ncbi:hypothetical protein SAMN04487891_11511 [Flagellimonas taeanensis]|uniref:Outer membrane protein beta-barrel domain-containing protein n=1 Tax=Flagellimonas taeanensis TaxID=1005926 RepID=A0A1M7C968_9FLAO|nr:DUF6048 family protein [Allomuricauda taeanensis]SFC61027.1 hypothetical protein SAMN04487891_11511 [Allomuricauda taeanensis]SHL63409.1 hypothetical protein SAMN05216293_3941 [Allomuricauda taeanensis]
MSRYFISLFVSMVLLPICMLGQSEPIDLQPKDTVEYKDEYGLRVGVDLSKLVLSFADEDYTGLELVGDYRLTQKLYLAAEIGNETKTQGESLNSTLLYNFKTSGSYIKVGAEVNTYQNWFGMNNAITIGGRFAAASFSQTLNDYTIFNSNHLYNPDFLPGIQPNQEFSGLNASWLEFVMGIKAELFANIYIGMSARLGFLVSNKEDERFPNLWIPGFNKVTDGSNFGVSYNYSISYFIPLYKKSKKKKEGPKQ